MLRFDRQLDYSAYLQHYFCYIRGEIRRCKRDAVLFKRCASFKHVFQRR